MMILKPEMLSKPDEFIHEQELQCSIVSAAEINIFCGNVEDQKIKRGLQACLNSPLFVEGCKKLFNDDAPLFSDAVWKRVCKDETGLIYARLFETYGLSGSHVVSSNPEALSFFQREQRLNNGFRQTKQPYSPHRFIGKDFKAFVSRDTMPGGEESPPTLCQR